MQSGCTKVKQKRFVFTLNIANWKDDFYLTTYTSHVTFFLILHYIHRNFYILTYRNEKKWLNLFYGRFGWCWMWILSYYCFLWRHPLYACMCKYNKRDCWSTSNEREHLWLLTLFASRRPFFCFFRAMQSGQKTKRTTLVVLLVVAVVWSGCRYIIAIALWRGSARMHTRRQRA